jgi:hypothetical protein
VFRRRLRLSAAAATGLLFAASAAISAQPAVVAAATADDPVVDVTIDSFTPAAPVPGQPVTITGRVTNTGTATFMNPQAIACIERERMSTRAQLASIDTEADQPLNDRNNCGGLTTADSTTFQLLGAPLAPKASVPFRLVVPWKEWKISDEPGVYTVGVRFRGDITKRDRTTGGLNLTLMPVIDRNKLPRKVNAAMVVPLRHRPTFLSGTQFATDSLAESMAPTGLLGRLLKLGEKQKVTWLVDPSMLDEAKKIQTGNYKVVDNQGQAKPGTGQKVVSAWLKAFDLSRAHNQTVLLPYGDPDVASLLAAGAPLKDLVGKSRATTEGYNLGGAYPSFNPGLWLENGSANSRNLAAASTGYAGQRGDDITLVNSSAWSPADRPNLLPTPVYNVSTPTGPVNSVSTVVADSSLTAGGPDPATAAQPLQIRQRFAAETSLIAGTGTGTATVVVAQPRDSDLTGRATAALMQGLSLPWITPVGLDQLKDVKPLPAKPISTQRTTPGMPEGQLEQLKEFSTAAGAYTSILVDPASATADSNQTMFRLSSYSWAGFPDEAQRFGTFERSAIANTLSKVHLVNSAVDRGLRKEIKVNLSGSKGTFPLTITNDLDVSVRVGIAVRSANRSDLRIAPLQTKVLAAGVKATYQINASAEQNGLIKANAQVVSASGAPIGKSKELVIQASQYGSVGWILVGAACALLFGTSAVRIYRRIRSEKRNPTTPAPGSDPLHPAPLDPQELAEPVTDSVEPVADELQPLLTPEPNGTAQESLKEGVGTKDG